MLFFSCKEKEFYFLEVTILHVANVIPPQDKQFWILCHFVLWFSYTHVDIWLCWTPSPRNHDRSPSWQAASWMHEANSKHAALPLTDPLLLVFQLSGAKAMIQLQKRGPNPLKEDKTMADKGTSFKEADLQKTKLPFCRSLFTRCML